MHIKYRFTKNLMFTDNNEVFEIFDAIEHNCILCNCNNYCDRQNFEIPPCIMYESIEKRTFGDDEVMFKNITKEYNRNKKLEDILQKT